MQRLSEYSRNFDCIASLFKLQRKHPRVPRELSSNSPAALPTSGRPRPKRAELFLRKPRSPSGCCGQPTKRPECGTKLRRPRHRVRAFNGVRPGAETEPQGGRCGIDGPYLVARLEAFDMRRVQRGYDLMTLGVGSETKDPLATVRRFYVQGVTDEFMEPVSMLTEAGAHGGRIEDGDGLVFGNEGSGAPDWLHEELAATRVTIPHANPAR